MILQDLKTIASDLDRLVERLNISTRLSQELRSTILIGHAEAFARSSSWQLREAITALEMGEGTHNSTKKP